MSALLAALFENHATADRVRTALVSEGFPTDRVELTSAHEPGQAAIGPAERPVEQLRDYFSKFFDRAEERKHIDTFVEGVKRGHASIVVHPRGDIETNRALDVLRSSHPIELRGHDLAKQSLEQAASPDSAPILKKLVPGTTRRN